MDQKVLDETSTIISRQSNPLYNFTSNNPGRFASSTPNNPNFNYPNRNAPKQNGNFNDFDGISLPATDDIVHVKNDHINLSFLDNDNEEIDTDSEFIKPDDFETMVGDLRHSFSSWLKKTESNYKESKDNFSIKLKEFKDFKMKTLKQIQYEKQFKSDKLKEDRRKLESEIASNRKQIQIERDDAMKKLNESKQKFDFEKQIQKRKFLIDKQKFQQEFESFQQDREKILENNIMSQTMVDINVGGVTFETSRNTLLKQPGSFLAEVISGRTQMTRDKQGNIFFDRDNESFRIILNFLRNSEFPPVPRDAEESATLTRESEFYRIKFFQYPLIFACGGHNGVEHLKDIELFDMNTQLWRPCEPLMTERSYMGGASFRSFLYIFGGQNLDYKALCDVEIYDCLRNTWMNGPPLNTSRRNNAGLTHKDRIFSLGGFDGLNVLSSVEALDPRMKSWMELSPMNVPRSALMAGVYDDNIIVMGGTKGNKLRSVEIYDIRVNKWMEFPSNLIEPRSSGASTTLQSNLVCVMGGTDNSHTVLDSCEVLNKEGIWSFMKNLPDPRIDFSAITISDSIMITGGQNIDVLNTTDFFRFDENDWKRGPPMIVPRYGHTLLSTSI